MKVGADDENLSIARGYLIANPTRFATSKSSRKEKARPKPGFHASRKRIYFAAISASVMSSMRLEKPHSLSYQLSTLTIVPCMTRVWVES